MKKVIRKTEKERREEFTCQGKMVKNTGYFYIVCDKCQMAFFDEDLISDCSDGFWRCPNLVKKGFWRKLGICNNQIFGGDEKSFERYYKLSNNLLK